MIAPHVFSCVGCGIRRKGEIHRGFAAIWVQPPRGWFCLIRASEKYVRCPKCMTAEGDS